MPNFLHGVEVLEVTDGPRPITTVSSSVIALVGSGSVHADFPADTPVLLTSARGVAAKLGETSWMTKAIEAVFKQTGAIVVVVRTTGGDTGVAGSQSDGTGVWALLDARNRVGYAPRIVVAEDADSLTTLDDVKSVVAKLKAVAVISLADSATATDATTWATANGNDRTYLVWPTINGGEDAAPYVAGVIAKTDNDLGFWWSPSNKEIIGITELDMPVDWELGEVACTANVLNEGNVATFIRNGGFRLWGNRVKATDQRYQFLVVRRTADLIFDSIKRAHLWAVDRGITKTYLADVAEEVTAYLRDLKGLGAVLGGACWPDPDLNTPTTIESGQVFFTFDFTPTYPAERVTFRAMLVNDYVSEILS